MCDTNCTCLCYHVLLPSAGSRLPSHTFGLVLLWHPVLCSPPPELVTLRVRVLQAAVSAASLWLSNGLPNGQLYSSCSRRCLVQTEGQHKCTIHTLHGCIHAGVSRSAAGPTSAAATAAAGCVCSAADALHAITTAHEHFYTTLGSACM